MSGYTLCINGKTRVIRVGGGLAVALSDLILILILINLLFCLRLNGGGVSI